MAAEHLIKAAQDRIESNELRNLASQRPKYSAQLNGDIAAADNGRSLRQCRKFEEAVGGDPQLRPRQIGDGRVAASRNQHVLAAMKRTAVILHFMRSAQYRAAANTVYRSPLEIVRVDTI